MRKLLLSLTASLACSVVAQAGPYFECDFSNGLPVEFSFFDEDILEPSADMKDIGFAIGTPWITAADEDGNQAAVSTSWYRKAGTSDDWMITPEFTVEGANAVLSWRAKAGDPDYRDGYKVYVSNYATNPGEFKALQPTLSVTQEKNAWTEHEISLADYTGQKIRIAFVNDSRDRATLWIDDIWAGVPSALRVKSNIPRVVNKDGFLSIHGTVTNTTENAVEGFTVTYSLNSGQEYESYLDLKVAPYGSVDFSFTSEAEVKRNTTYTYQLGVRTPDSYSSTSGKVSCMFRRIVAEECTGTWCGYCVRGIVAMNEMKATYPDSFLGIAVHASSPSWEDPMDFTSYSDFIFDSLGISGFPGATVNRRKTETGDPSNISRYYTQILERDLTAGLNLSIPSFDTTTRTGKAHTNVYFVDDLENIDYSLGYVLIENDVHKDAIVNENGQSIPFNGYEQNNYYAGGGQGTMGGFENLRSTVPGSEMTYQDVARSFWGDDFEGFHGVLPSRVKADTPYSHEFEFELPDNVLNDNNTELAVLLINRKTGEIVNADVVSLENIQTSVGSIQDDEERISIRTEGDLLIISGVSLIRNTAVFGADGRLMKQANGASNASSIDTANLHGVFIVRITTDNSVITKKIRL